MNKLNARSNTGEGGEDSDRFHETYDAFPCAVRPNRSLPDVSV